MLKRFIEQRGAIVPLLAAILAGLTLGLGIFTFVYAKGGAYLTNDPAACANCHVMQEQYQGWLKGSHRSAAVCNDCHAPAGFIGKYATKAINGYFHSCLVREICGSLIRSNRAGKPGSRSRRTRCRMVGRRFFS